MQLSKKCPACEINFKAETKQQRYCKNLSCRSKRKKKANKDYRRENACN